LRCDVIVASTEAPHTAMAGFCARRCRSYQSSGRRTAGLSAVGTTSPSCAPDSSARPTLGVMSARASAARRNAILNVLGEVRATGPLWARLCRLHPRSSRRPFARSGCGLGASGSGVIGLSCFGVLARRWCGFGAAPTPLFEPHVVLDRLHATDAFCNPDRLVHLGLGIHEAAQLHHRPESLDVDVA